MRTVAAALLLVILAQGYMSEISLASPPAAPETNVSKICASLTLPDERLIVLPCSPEVYRMANRLPAVPAFSYFLWQDRVAPLRREMVEKIENQQAKLLVINWWLPAAGSYAFATYAEEIRDAIQRNYRQLSVGIPTLYARNASFYEMLGRYERVRTKPVLEVPQRNILPLAVHGPVTVTQYFTLNDRVASPSLELLVSALRRTDSVARIEFGSVGSDGREKTQLRESFKTAEVRYYPGVSGRTFWRSMNLTAGGMLKPGHRYFFRLSSPASDVPEAVQLWSAPHQTAEGLGRTLYGGAPTSRTVCFRVSGVTRPKSPGCYPIVEQSLARSSFTATAAIRQGLTLPEATSLSAVALLLGGDGQTTGPTPYLLEILGKDGQRLTSQTVTAPRRSREWQLFTFAPLRLKRGQQLTLAVRPNNKGRPQDRPAAAPPLSFWTSGCDLYAGGRLSVGDQPRDDDLCFKLYETAPHQPGLPDIVVSGLSFEPAFPISVTPQGALRLTLRLENRGTTATGPFWIEFYATPRDVSGPDVFLAESQPIANLKPGEVLGQTLARAVNPLADGLYTVSALADRILQVRESDEENNRAVAEGKELLVVARESSVDLFVDQFRMRGEKLKRDRPIEFSGVVSNFGKATAGHFVIEFWASPEPDQRQLRVPLCDPIAVDSLAPYAVIDLSMYPRTVKSDIPTGRLYIGCTVDVRNEIVETYKWDNTAVVGPVTVEP